ncbi:uncharacterized protein LOC120259822 [Dioscorea cayenensis subsp. rotundata]|uniref:Uncharacterized protein LOC120259822 n=1 Tax=Dioscorea cayennensis subsp. rotundata TaxID=55577 RepID=A0AB40B7F5_DIOCR|nr:uncharacterized protein LOC120259822 [Dioscorea cayenensis subsp. rotundata]
MLVGFRDAAKMRTKKLVFEEVFYACDAKTLERLKELSSRRRVIEQSINQNSNITEAIAREMSGGSSCPYEQDLQKLERYLPLLINLVFYTESVKTKTLKLQKRVTDFKIRWSSPLSASCIMRIGSPKFYSIDNLRFELGMSLFLYGATLRERAFETLLTDLKETSTLFRKAAGVYRYLAEVILPPLQVHLAKDRPPEVTSSLSTVMSLICLADAQAATVKRAEEKGNSPSLLSKLHLGVNFILHEANSVLALSEEEGNDVSAKFKELLPINITLHELRSRRYLAEHLQHESHGTAVAVLRHAVAKAKKVRNSNSNSWCRVISQEISDADKKLKKLEYDNETVYHEKIPSADSLPVLESKIIVDALPYEPQTIESSELYFQI